MNIRSKLTLSYLFLLLLAAATLKTLSGTEGGQFADRCIPHGMIGDWWKSQFVNWFSI